MLPETQRRGYKRYWSFLYPVILLSYLFPILRRRAFDNNETLELYLYRNQYQLGTADALYSDGSRYRPITAAFDHLGNKELQRIEKVLVLGTGLASVAYIFNARKCTPSYTMVEYNETILKWAMELLPDKIVSSTNAVLADAADYVQRETGKYDLVVVDIFKGRVVPDFVTTRQFLEKCKCLINAQRHLVLNYIVNDEDEWESAHNNITAVFPNYHVLDHGINRIYIATV